jgi:hypothetical protein
MDGLVYQEVPMPSDTSYEIGVLANADAYTDITLNGSGHLRVTVDPTCVTVDYVAAYLPKDTLEGYKNREIRYQYKVGACAVPTGGGPSINDPFFEIFPNPATEKLNIRVKNTAAFDRRIELVNLQGQLIQSTVLDAGLDACTMHLGGVLSGVYLVKISNGNFVKTLKVAVF